MSSDIVMIALTLAGIVLSITYFYVAVALWRQGARRELGQGAAMRQLHAQRVGVEKSAAIG